MKTILYFFISLFICAVRVEPRSYGRARVIMESSEPSNPSGVPLLSSHNPAFSRLSTNWTRCWVSPHKHKLSTSFGRAVRTGLFCDVYAVESQGGGKFVTFVAIGPFLRRLVQYILKDYKVAVRKIIYKHSSFPLIKKINISNSIHVTNSFIQKCPHDQSLNSSVLDKCFPPPGGNYSEVRNWMNAWPFPAFGMKIIVDFCHSSRGLSVGQEGKGDVGLRKKRGENGEFLLFDTWIFDVTNFLCNIHSGPRSTWALS